MTPVSPNDFFAVVGLIYALCGFIELYYEEFPFGEVIILLFIGAALYILLSLSSIEASLSSLNAKREKPNWCITKWSIIKLIYKRIDVAPDRSYDIKWLIIELVYHNFKYLPNSHHANLRYEDAKTYGPLWGHRNPIFFSLFL